MQWILVTRVENMREMKELLESARINHVFQDVGDGKVRLSVPTHLVDKSRDTLAAKFMRASGARMD
jgi:hypothetical protein